MKKGTSPRQRIRAFSLNVLLLLVSTAVGYLIVEFTFFRIFLPNVKFDIRAHLPETADVLVQNSKAGFVPRNYIALFGDSYAEGIGDWLLNNHGNEALPFNPADLLHQLTGRDVVSFGRGGSSSAEALVRQPARILAGSQCLIFPTLSDPERVFAFFYAGNDIQDNLRFLGKVRSRYGNDDGAAVDRFLAEQYASYSIFQCHLYLGDTIGRMARFAYEYHNFDPNELTPHGLGANRLVVAGKEIAAPTPLSASAMEIDERRMAAGMLVFDRSLAWLSRRFANLPVAVVYIPSPLAIYRKAGSKVVYRIEPPEADLSDSTTPDAVDRKDYELCAAVRDTARKYALGFLDAGPALRAAAAEKLIHGPVDWDHLNELGYRTFAGFLAGKLKDLGVVESCQQ